MGNTQLLDLFLIGDLESYLNADVRKAKYPLLSPSKLRIVLDRCVFVVCCFLSVLILVIV